MTIKVLILNGELPDTYVAIGLDKYIIAQGCSIEEAKAAWWEAASAEIGYGLCNGFEDPLQDIPEAPEKYWSIYYGIEEKEKLFPERVLVKQDTKRAKRAPVPWDGLELRVAA